MSYLEDRRTKRQILLDIERKIDRLIGEKEMADIFTRIALALGALQVGDTSALQAHVAEIDTHLSDVDASVLGLQSDDTSSKARLDAIEAGIGKIADAVNPTSTGGTTTSGDGSATSANPGGGTDTGAVSGSGPAAGNPGGQPDPGAQSGTGPDAGNPGGDGSIPAPVASQPSDGSQSADVTPGADPVSAHASAPIPSSGVGSETTGQVDTPVTQ